MLSSILKRKLTDNQVANIFINAIYETVDNGFKEVAQLINEDVVFVKSPGISENQNGEFALVVIVGNLSFLESTFDADQAVRVEKIIFEKLAFPTDHWGEDYTYVCTYSTVSTVL